MSLDPCRHYWRGRLESYGKDVFKVVVVRVDIADVSLLSLTEKLSCERSPDTSRIPDPKVLVLG
jgi:hypothetical protein